MNSMNSMLCTWQYARTLPCDNVIHGHAILTRCGTVVAGIDWRHSSYAFSKCMTTRQFFVHHHHQQPTLCFVSCYCYYLCNNGTVNRKAQWTIMILFFNICCLWIRSIVECIMYNIVCNNWYVMICAVKDTDGKVATNIDLHHHHHHHDQSEQVSTPVKKKRSNSGSTDTEASPRKRHKCQSGGSQNEFK